MTPKEKADELITQFGIVHAIKAVDLIMQIIWGKLDEATENYWRAVLLELQTKTINQNQ